MTDASGQLAILTHMKRNWPYYWVSRVNAGYVQVLERRLKPLGLDMPRWRVLISLYEEEYLSVSQIAEISTMRLNTTTKVVQRMQADGLITTRISPLDRRVTQVRLTPEGDVLRVRGLEEANRVLAASFVDVSADELAQLNATLEKVFGQLQRI
ncbi:MarR family transcriptional regulator [Pseudooceanicola sp. HF7]|nr:MarR family transcriptional regulator [Pseudooceanicola sp. HF7]